MEDVKKLISESLKISLNFFKENRFQEAEVVLQQLLRVQPNNVYGLQLLGLVNHKVKNYSEAIKLFSKALKIEPQNAENHNNIALSYAGMGFVDKAIEHANKSIEIDSKNHNYYSNLGLHYRQSGNLKQAISNFQISLECNSKNYFVWSNLGATYGCMKDLKQAEYCFKKSIEYNPEHHESYVDLAHVYFLQGNYSTGWPLYEYRLSYFPPAQIFKQVYDEAKRWDGKQSIKDKKIVVYCEQGRGDLIHFCRFIPELKKLGANILIHSPKDMIKLMEFTFKLPTDVFFKEYDFHTSLISLPGLLGIDNVDVNPYLICEKIANLENYKDSFNIGIVWAGNPQHPADRIRSCKLDNFKEIYKLPNVKLFNLQKDLRPRQYTGESEIHNLSYTENLKVIDLSEFIDDFNDTAAFINTLDLIISADTAVLHLAGALGKPVWGLIPFNPDWRWGLDNDTTIWYPSMKLFRQNELGNWQGIFDDILSNLRQQLQKG